MPAKAKHASWRELLSRAGELGMDALSLTKEAGQKVAAELVKKGKMTRGEAKEALDHLLEISKKRRAHLEEVVSKAVDRALKKADEARGSEIKALKRRIAALEKKPRKRVTVKKK
ncbi:MAG: hypothetical protein GTO55_10180 [Armatimonadetes bacterium]|nr:hypothetical protein [Armatimonadota bacterium]NIM24608.1 hypothetical protein [Armatimonadota bacterium]NIM68484.1 hypothetical protein [Armatimonadota bacterium]NIM76869.1 hypothetical protein [Armatimonadota bacterium]NIN06681.1 hypothetical protein [Armatimonadota bacterium]